MSRDNLNDDHLIILIEQHPNPERVYSLQLCLNDFSEDLIKKIVRFNRLEWLEIGLGGQSIQPSTIIFLLKNLPELKHLDMNETVLSKEQWIQLFETVSNEAGTLPKNLVHMILTKSVLNLDFSKEELKDVYTSLMPILTFHLPKLEVLEILEEDEASIFQEEMLAAGQEHSIWLNCEALRTYKHSHLLRRDRL